MYIRPGFLHLMCLEAISSQLNTVCVFSAADTEIRLNTNRTCEMTLKWNQQLKEDILVFAVFPKVV